MRNTPRLRVKEFLEVLALTLTLSLPVTVALHQISERGKPQAKPSKPAERNVPKRRPNLPGKKGEPVQETPPEYEDPSEPVQFVSLSDDYEVYE